MFRHFPRGLFPALGLLLLSASLWAAPKKIVLIAGPITGHPKGIHEYEKDIVLLKHLLDTSPNFNGATVETHFRGWPEDPSTLEDADSIVLFSDGSNREESAHPLHVDRRLEALGRQMQRGCGLVQIHWATFHPTRLHEKVTEWVGGYFDYETGPEPRKWFSAIKTYKGPISLPAANHPIARGVKPFELQEEFYYRIRFNENDERVKPIVRSRPPGEERDFAVGWAVQRADGGRGFGFTGGHYFENWWKEDYRKLLLNAVAWSAGAKIPESGIESDPGERFKVLIVTGYHHPGHDWRALTTALLGVLEQDPRVTVHVTENPEDLKSVSPKEYPLIVMNYCNWDRPGLSDEAKAGFVDYLKTGGALSVIHYANGAFTPTLPSKDDPWPEYYQKMVRRHWLHGKGNSGHDKYGPFQVDITDVDHPITRGLKPFETIDELYFRQAGDLPITPLATARSKVTGHDEPMAFAYDYEGARVFQTVLGHSEDSIRGAGALIRRGCVWAAGYDNISFDPPPEFTQGMLFRKGSQWTPAESSKKAQAKEKEAQVKEEKAETKGKEGPEKWKVAGTGGASDPTRQTDADWMDDRWQQTDIGQFLCAAIETPGRKTYKGIAIKVGDGDAGAVVFDTDLMRYSAGWTGGFLKLHPRRYGLINAPTPDGEVMFQTRPFPGWARDGSFADPRDVKYGRLPDDRAKYRGLHLSGDRVTLAYTVNGVSVLESPWLETEQGLNYFVRTLEVAPSDRELRLQLCDVRPGQARARIPHAEGWPAVHSVHYSGRIQAAAVRQTKSGPKLSSVRGAEAGWKLLEGALTVRIPPRSGKVTFDVLIWEGPEKDFDAFQEAARRRLALKAESPSRFTRGGKPNWTRELVTKGTVGRPRDGFAIDTVKLPFDNPWNALFFTGGLDFFDNGDIALCTAHGDVWRVSGVDQDLAEVRWKRYATGLFQPLGLKIVNNTVHVIERGQITRLHDLDGDNEADHYECFNNDVFAAGGGHAYATSLETDPQGNFWFMKCAEDTPHGGTLMKVSADGSKLEVVATGFRNPNGMGVSPDGTVTAADQQGTWVPETRLDVIRKGGFYGYMPMHKHDIEPTAFDPPLIWIPRPIDNSAGGQTWAPKDAWGPLGGKMLHLSYGRCTFMAILRDAANGGMNGTAVPLPGRFLSGVMRARFSPHDGHLYLTGLKGWQTAAVHDGCLQRVRYTGDRLYLPTAVNVHANGIRIEFSQPLEKEFAEDVESYALEQWNYRWTANYGSPDFKPSNPAETGRDPVKVQSARLLPDGRSVFLKIGDVRPVMALAIRYNLDAKDGELLRGEAYTTINRVGEAFGK